MVSAWAPVQSEMPPCLVDMGLMIGTARRFAWLAGVTPCRPLRGWDPTPSHPSRGCLREGAKSYVKQVNRQRRGASTAVQEARTFWPCSRNWPCGPTYL